MSPGKILLMAGVDEVGRGPLAGAVVTAAVILKGPIAGLADSKKLTAKKRKQLSIQIQQEALAYAYGRAEADEIDEVTNPAPACGRVGMSKVHRLDACTGDG